MISILIIGSAGFIGSNLVSKSLNLGYKVYGLDIKKVNITNYDYFNISIETDDFLKLMSKIKFDYVVNCSGSADVSFSIHNPLKDFQLNVSSVFFVLNAIKEFQPNTTYLHFSSAAVYGNPDIFPISETSILKPISPYGFHKYQSEMICKEFAELYDLNIKIIRAFSVFGVGLRKQLLWDIYQKGLNNNTVEFWGTGDETRDFIYIDDLIEVIFLILINSNSKYDIYNVANGNDIKINDLVTQFYNLLGWNINISFNQLCKPGDPKFWKANIDNIKSLGYQQKYSLEQGLLKTAKWYQNYVAN